MAGRYDSDDEGGAGPVDTWSPRPLLDPQTRSTFVINQDDIAALAKYLISCQYIPSTRKQLTDLLRIPPQFLRDDNWALIDAVLAENITMKGDTYNFHFTTYPKMITFCENLLEFANNAGGTESSSYYGLMLKYSRELPRALQARDQPAIDELKQNIRDFLDLNLKSIRAVAVKCKDVVNDFDTFMKKCTTSQENLNNLRNRVKDEVWQGDDDPFEAWEKAEAQRPALTTGSTWEEIIANVEAQLKLQQMQQDFISLSFHVILTDISWVQNHIGPALHALGAIDDCLAKFDSNLNSLSSVVERESTEGLQGAAVEKAKARKVVENWNFLAQKLEVFISSVRNLPQVDTGFEEMMNHIKEDVDLFHRNNAYFATLRIWKQMYDESGVDLSGGYLKYAD